MCHKKVVNTLGLEAALLESGFLPWEEPAEIIWINQLNQIKPQHRSPPIRSVVRIHRLNQKDQRVFEETRRQIAIPFLYPTKEELTVAYDYYNLDILTGKKGVASRLDHPILIVALGVEYGKYRITRKGKVYQETTNLNLRPANADLVESLFNKQVALQAAILKALTGIVPEIFCVREGRPEYTQQLDLRAHPTIAGPDTELITRYAFPGGEEI